MEKWVIGVIIVLPVIIAASYPIGMIVADKQSEKIANQFSFEFERWSWEPQFFTFWIKASAREEIPNSVILSKVGYNLDLYLDDGDGNPRAITKLRTGYFRSQHDLSRWSDLPKKGHKFHEVPVTFEGEDYNYGMYLLKHYTLNYDYGRVDWHIPTLRLLGRACLRFRIKYFLWTFERDVFVGIDMTTHR